MGTVQEYPLERFRIVCEQVLENNINPEIVLRSLALTYSPWNQNRERLEDRVRPACLDFIADHFEEVNIHSIRHIQPQGIQIAHDLLDVIHFRKRQSKRSQRERNNRTSQIRFQ